MSSERVVLPVPTEEKARIDSESQSGKSVTLGTERDRWLTSPEGRHHRVISTVNERVDGDQSSTGTADWGKVETHSELGGDEDFRLACRSQKYLKPSEASYVPDHGRYYSSLANQGWSGKSRCRESGESTLRLTSSYDRRRDGMLRLRGQIRIFLRESAGLGDNRSHL